MAEAMRASSMRDGQSCINLDYEENLNDYVLG